MSFSACTQALVKKPINPSLLPCFFSNTSLYCARIAMMWLMSTSLKVVSIAAVFCTSFRRRAMVWRSRVIFTRSSRAASSAGDGAGAPTGGGRRGADLNGGGRLVDRGRRGSRLLDRGQHVALGDAAVLAGARHGGGIDAAFGGEFSNRRRQWRIRCRSLRRRSRRGGGRCSGSGGLGRRSRGRLGAGRTDVDLP